MTTNFGFLRAEWPELFTEAQEAERRALLDPRSSCFYARRTLELLVRWLYEADRTLRNPYRSDLSAQLHEPTFKRLIGAALLAKANLIRKKGNNAVHGNRPVNAGDSVSAVRELFHVTFWFARNYAIDPARRPAPAAQFNEQLLPDPATRQAAAQQAAQSRAQLQKLEADLHARDDALAEQRKHSETLEAELERLRAEVDKAKAASAAVPDTHDYGEAQTRTDLIDELLKEAGWSLTEKRDCEFPVTGMPTPSGKGYVDYVLWGDDGKPLAVVEAKRTTSDAKVGKQQAKLYADCLEQAYGQRPLIYYTNGFEHWFWDDQRYPARQVEGFHNRDELALTVQRHTTRKSLADAIINTGIVDRDYQHRAVRRVAETFERDNQRKALVVMATGTGKTRAVIALADLLLRCNWAKRVLFLADRTALVNQAVNAFKANLPDSSPVNLVDEKTATGRVYVSTYQTMMGLIDASRDTERPFGIGHFDLVVIDEAHRSVYQKYRAIFEYFDSLLVGLTATPRDEIDRNTFSLFDIEDRVPTDSYALDEAVADGYLVRYRAIAHDLRIPSRGLHYNELSDEEKEQWDALEWTEDGEIPTEVDPDSINRWLFNRETVDLVLETLMTKGIHVAGGDRIGKTIIFAKNNAHADFIEQRFNANYPELRGSYARTITYQTRYNQSLIDDFSSKDKSPHIAISVDMLDTGIDVPEVVNLVFFKIVRSKTKFWQMIGRGTRLCPDLFGPDQDKHEFYIFDFGGNFEFFSHNPNTTEAAPAEPLGQQLFRRRVSLLGGLDEQLVRTAHLRGSGDPLYDATLDLRNDIADQLHHVVANMNTDNFIVRRHRRWVETYADRKAWDALDVTKQAEVADHLSGLPSAARDTDENAKRFDLVVFNTQLCLLTGQDYTPYRDVIREIAHRLLDQTAIPAIRDQQAILEAMTQGEWWTGITLPMLEQARRKVRGLVRLMKRTRRKIVYTDFSDDLSAPVEHRMLGGIASVDRKRFRTKVRSFLDEHPDHVALQRLRRNVPLTATDLAELERMFAESGEFDRDLLDESVAEAQGLGLFIRSLVGLDRSAATEVMAGFVQDTTMTANQLEFVNLIVEHLTRNGVMEPWQLYEPPFTDVAPTGPDQIFDRGQVAVIVEKLHEVRDRATA